MSSMDNVSTTSFKVALCFAFALVGSRCGPSADQIAVDGQPARDGSDGDVRVEVSGDTLGEHDQDGLEANGGSDGSSYTDATSAGDGCLPGCILALKVSCSP